MVLVDLKKLEKINIICTRKIQMSEAVKISIFTRLVEYPGIALEFSFWCVNNTTTSDHSAQGKRRWSGLLVNPVSL